MVVLHRRCTRAAGHELVSPSGDVAPDASPRTVEDALVGSMTFYRVHLDRGRNGFWAMEEECEELYGTAQVLLDPATGAFTDEVSEGLEYDYGRGAGLDRTAPELTTLDRRGAVIRRRLHLSRCGGRETAVMPLLVERVGGEGYGHPRRG